MLTPSFSERAILISAFLRRMAFSESISHHCVAGASSLLKRETFSRRWLAWIRIQSGGQGWSRLTKVVRQFSTDWTKCLKPSAILDACFEAENLYRDRIANPVAIVHVFLFQVLQLTNHLQSGKVPNCHCARLFYLASVCIVENGEVCATKSDDGLILMSL